MKSRTKYNISEDQIKSIFEKAGLKGVTDISALGAGEFNAVFSVTAGGREYALKITPTQETPVLTYEKGMMKAELFWYEQLRQNTDITVPKVFYSDFEHTLIPADYFIMEKLGGVQLDKMKFLPDEKDDATMQTARMAAAIHRIKNNQFGYVQRELFPDWYQALRHFVADLLADCKKSGHTSSRGEKLLKAIDRNKEVFEKAECSMVNFDLWPANILCTREKGKIAYAWIDPERSFWGDRVCDFTSLEMLCPFAKKKRALTSYNAASKEPLAATKDVLLRYAAAEGLLGLIMEAEKYYRYTPSYPGWWRNVIVTNLLYRQAFGVLCHD